MLLSNQTAPFSNNHLLKDLRVPNGYLVNNIHTKPTPLIYNNSRHCIDDIDDKCIDKCLKLVEIIEPLPKTKTKKHLKNIQEQGKPKKTRKK